MRLAVQPLEQPFRVYLLTIQHSLSYRIAYNRTNDIRRNWIIVQFYSKKEVLKK